MRVLVTGGSGFIGSHVVDVLLGRAHTPVIFDRIPSPHHEPGAVETVFGEVTDSEALESAMRGCDAVIHLAAMADVGDVKLDPEGAELANSRGTLAVLEGARRTEIGRVVYGSTIWVYSDCAEMSVDEETRLAAPGHLYTATKLAGELYCRSYAELYDVEYTILRFGIPYGPRARPAAVVPMFVNKALTGEPLTVAGSGSQGRRFVYVEDLADGIVRGLNPVAANRVYNLAGTETTTILEIAQAVKAIVGDTEIVHTPARAGDFPGKEVSSERARDELGWEPSTPFVEGVTRYVAWRRAQEPAPPLEEPVPAGSTSREPVGATLAAATGLPGGGATTWLNPPLRRLPGSGLARRAARLFEAPPLAGVKRSIGGRRLRPALSAVAVTGAFFWSFATDDMFPLLTKAFGARPQTSVSTSRREVGLLIHATPAAAPRIAAALARQGAGASFALPAQTGHSALGAIKASGSDAVPQLRSGEFVRWLATRSELRGCAKRLGLSGHLYYAPPTKGFTFGQDLLGHTAGATPVQGAVRVVHGLEHGRLHRGAVVEVQLGGDPGRWDAVITRLIRQLRADGLAAKPADLMLREAGRRHR